MAMGARLITGARVRKIETNGDGLATGATWMTSDGKEHFEAGQGRRFGGQRDRHAADCCCCRPAASTLTVWPTSSGLVGKRLMMHPSPTSPASSKSR
jgi:hypothetical protein